MRFTPDEIENRRFLTDLRGYDRAEVDAFLRELAADYRELLSKLEDARRVAGMDGRDPFERVGDQVAATLRAATEEAERLRAEAREERAELLAEATRLQEQVRDELARAQATRAVAEQEGAQPRTPAPAAPPTSSLRRLVTQRWTRPRGPG